MFINLSLRVKLIVMCTMLLAIPATVIGVTNYFVSKSELDAAGKIALKNDVRLIISMIDTLHSQVKQGKMTLEEAQETARQKMLGPKQADGTRPINKDIDLGKNGYFMAYDKAGVEVAHPKLEGKNMWETKTIDDLFLVQEQIKQGIQGGGYTVYKWALPDNKDKIATKITYSELDPNWGWIISAGSYMSDYNSGANKIFYILLLVIGISLCIGMAAVLLYSRMLVGPIIMMAKEAREIANGNLNIKPVIVKNKDELGELANNFNYMADNLRNLIVAVDSTTNHIVTVSQGFVRSTEEACRAAEQVTGAIQEVATGSEAQVSVSQDSVLAMKKMTEKVQHISDSTIQMTKVAASTAEQVKEGTTWMGRAGEEMKNIHMAVDETSTVISTLQERSNQIGQILQVITNIASQTNLLALNASIEAARAGEHGKGFAVVAGEVKKLAEQVKDSAEQITGLVTSIQEETVRTVASMNVVDNQVKTGIVAIDEAEKIFKIILSSTEDIVEQINKVSTSSQEMSTGTHQITFSLAELAKIAEEASQHSQNVAIASEEQTATMGEIADSSHKLEEMMMQLGEITAKFKAVS